MADYSDPLGLLFGGVDYFGSPQKSKGLLQLTPQEIERMAAAQSPAFGVFPQMQPYRSQQDITASANVPVDVARGRVAGTLGLFGDVFNQPIPMVRPLQLLSQAMTGQQKYPDTEYFLENLPLKSDTPVGDVAGRIGSFAPINPMPAVRGAQKLGGLLGEEMATRLNTGKPLLPSLLAEPQTAMFAVNPAEQAMTSGLLQAEVSPLGFYSAVEQQALKIPRKQGTGESFLNDLLKGQDVKKYEIEAMGLDTYLKGKPNVTRQEVQDFIQNNKINVQEKQLGGTITEDPIGIAKRKEVFDKYEPQIQDLYRRIDKPEYVVYDPETNKVLKSYTNYDDALLDNLDPLGAFGKTKTALRPKENSRQLQQEITDLQNIRDAEADAAYIVPESAPTKYDRFQLAGGENYRELLLTLPEAMPNTALEIQQFTKRMETMRELQNEFANAGNMEKAISFAQKADDLQAYIKQLEKIPVTRQTENYQSSHFNEPNILAHMRVNDRVDAEGKKMLLIEEVQSDWHQAGREQGYKTKESLEKWYNQNKLDNDPAFAELNSEQRSVIERNRSAGMGGNNAVPDAPFKDTWYQLALKRAIKEAVDKGYDRIGLTTGAQQAARYDLSKQVDNLLYSKNADGTYRVSAQVQGRGQMIGEAIPESKLSDYVGKEIAEKMSKGTGKQTEVAGEYDPASMTSNKKYMTELSGIDLKVGGEGMKKYYDEIYPNFLNKYGKKYGAQVGETYINANAKAQTKDQLAKELYGNNETYKNLPSEQKRKVDVMFMDMAKEEKIRYLDITPEMKKAVQKGQPLAAVEGMTGLLA